MSLKEVTGTRDLTYSGWHRPPNLSRHCCYIDIDSLEYCCYCNEFLFLIETAIDTSRDDKGTFITRLLAKKLNIPAYLVYYRKGQQKNEILSFRVKQISPTWENQIIMTPEQYKDFIYNFREVHYKARGHDYNPRY